MTTKAQLARWCDVMTKTRGGGGQLAAQRDGATFSHIIAADNATRDLAAADELRAPGWLSHEDMRRELGEGR